MRSPPFLIAPSLLAVFLLGGCHHESTTLLGTLEWDRIGVAAEASEPIIAIDVVEGQQVSAGTPLLHLDPRRSDAQIAQADAQLQGMQAALAELEAGTRSETIATARANLASAQASVANAKKERERIAAIRARGLVAQATLDDAQTALKTATANAAALRAQLDEQTNGARSQTIDQAHASVAAARAELAAAQLSRQRLDVVAPRDGRIDALPFKLGDQPPQGATVVSLLSGPSPYARIFVPSSRRAAMVDGMTCNVHVQGVDAPYTATLRSLRSDPAFTPYYALTGDDASRLAYRAELTLQGDKAQALPAGLPVQADCDAP